MFGPTLLRGQVSMLGKGEGLEVFSTNQAENPLDLAFGDIIVKALWARINSSSGHMWPPDLSLPTSLP